MKFKRATATLCALVLGSGLIACNRPETSEVMQTHTGLEVETEAVGKQTTREYVFVGYLSTIDSNVILYNELSDDAQGGMVVSSVMRIPAIEGEVIYVRDMKGTQQDPDTIEYHDSNGHISLDLFDVPNIMQMYEKAKKEITAKSNFSS